MHTLLMALGDAVSTLLYIYEILLLVQWVLGLVGADPYNPLVRAVAALTEPLLGWLRLRLPFLVWRGWDFSYVAAWLVCQFLNWAVVGQLWRLAARFT
jgi:uncharacterized protein YggT (Ycf19 family)